MKQSGCFRILFLFVCLQIYELLVLETKPGNAVSIIECDMQVLILFSEAFFVWCDALSLVFSSRKLFQILQTTLRGKMRRLVMHFNL